MGEWREGKKKFHVYFVYEIHGDEGEYNLADYSWRVKNVSFLKSVSFLKDCL